MNPAMRKSLSLSRGKFFFSAILVLAFVLRFIHLGNLPLNEFEAGSALAAYGAAGVQAAGLGSQPAYVLLTSLLFSLFGSSTFLARLVPALSGFALILLPYFWREKLGEKAALVLTLFLAIDPGLVALSRLASGTILGIFATLAALTFWRARRPVVMGMLAAIALMSGPSIFYGLGAAILVWLVVRPAISVDKSLARSASVAFVVTLLLGATLLLSFPGGLSGVGAALAAFFVGQGFEPASVGTIAFALFGYGLPALVFGGWRIWLAWRQNAGWEKLLSLFAAGALLLLIVNPNRQVADLVWVLLPLWVLAAFQLGDYLYYPKQEPLATFGEMALMLILAVFFILGLARAAGAEALLYYELGSLVPAIEPRLLIVAFVVGVAILASILIGLGWSTRAASQGAVWTLGLVFCLFLLSASTHFLRGPADVANELWTPGPAVGDLGLLTETLHDFSFWTEGQLHAVPIQYRTDSTALHWALRDYPQDDSGNQSPQLAVTSAAEQPPAEFSNYRGQSFAVGVQRSWGPWPTNFFSWLMFRQAPTQEQQIILWVRADLFADGGANSQAPLDTTP